MLDEFASDYLGGPGLGRDVRAEFRVLSSVRVLGEGVDTAECDAVLFSDARGSMVDTVGAGAVHVRHAGGLGSVGTHPLGAWIADQRRYYTAGTLEASRVAELEKLGMVWSVHPSAWDAGLDVARSYAAVHGHFLPAASVVWESIPLGVWAKKNRAAARKATENAERRAAGDTGLSYSGELPESRMEALADVDPGWCPAWEIGWQRSYRLALAHVRA
ncbi:helicase associated domain-containing protein [Streptomyces sp. M41(2017)]|uniref:helicase associated domain-containing protein n=1 Tax=Streptomyces sp. M41(2017) TaxID=1955065 RepID=UPI001F4DAB81|nr:helicase associated domain-containing protein [Streptomyces sp. M41(2017)]